MPGSFGEIVCGGCDQTFAVHVGATEISQGGVNELHAYQQFECTDCGQMKSALVGEKERKPHCPECRRTMSRWPFESEGIDDAEFIGGPCPKCGRLFTEADIALNGDWD